MSHDDKLVDDSYSNNCQPNLFTERCTKYKGQTAKQPSVAYVRLDEVDKQSV